MGYSIALLPGDGIGKEVTAAAVDIMKTIAEIYSFEIGFTEYLMGGCSYDEYGTPLTEETLEGCKKADAVFLGAVGGYKWEKLPHHLKPEAALLRLRKELGLFANLRPAKIYEPLIDSSTLKKETLTGVDFMVLRELTGGIYFGTPRGFDEEKGWNTMVYAREEVERIAHKAFQIARLRSGKVTSVDKANVLEVSQFWRNIVHRVHEEYNDIELVDMYVDNAAMQIVRNPKQFDVIVTSNLFGDILSDIAGMITGSLGMLPSASLGELYGLYEPVHGSAPDIAGKGIANPLAAISSTAMMFKYSFNMSNAAELIESAVTEILEAGYRTADIYSDGCTQVGTEHMCALIKENIHQKAAYARESYHL